MVQFVHIFFVYRSGILQSYLEVMGGSVCHILEGVVIYIKSQFVEKNFYEFEVESWKGSEVRVDCTF